MVSGTSMDTELDTRSYDGSAKSQAYLPGDETGHSGIARTRPTAMPSWRPSGFASSTSLLTLEKPVSADAGARAKVELKRESRVVGAVGVGAGAMEEEEEEEEEGDEDGEVEEEEDEEAEEFHRAIGREGRWASESVLGDRTGEEGSDEECSALSSG